MKLNLKKIISTTSISLFFLTINISTEAQSLHRKETIPNSTSKCSLVSEDVKNGQTDKAIALVKQQIAADSQNPTLSVNLGRLYQSVGSIELAAQTYTEAIKLAKAAQEPVELILAADGLAEILTLQGEKTEAESLFQEAKEALGFDAKQLNLAQSSCSGVCGDCQSNGKDGKPVYMPDLGCICRTSVC